MKTRPTLLDYAVQNAKADPKASMLRNSMVITQPRANRTKSQGSTLKQVKKGS